MITFVCGKSVCGNVRVINIGADTLITGFVDLDTTINSWLDETHPLVLASSCVYLIFKLSLLNFNFSVLAKEHILEEYENNLSLFDSFPACRR